ncbi:MAG: CoA pyrophosphatase [Desulfurococcales archaeon]|nr:CoA pyrophosphatase [Desulfurococcales archaeon]
MSLDTCPLRKNIDGSEDVDASVLAVLWGTPPRVLLVRKSCRRKTYWSCDAALPGGHIEEHEGPVEAALREAWEEAWIHRGSISIKGVLPIEVTRIGKVKILPIIGVVSGPICYRPNSEEVDEVFWENLSILDRPPRIFFHPNRRLAIEGYVLDSGAILWGATLRILRRIHRSLQSCPSLLDPFITQHPSPR